MFAAVRGTRIYFDVEGMGLVPDGHTMRERPVAMVIHGGPGGDHSGFKPGFSSLGARMQLVYFDHRGQGRSDAADPETYTLDENVEDMEALRRHLGLGPIVSIGTSYGGMVAMAHAARYPDAVSHLVLIVTPACPGACARAGHRRTAGGVRGRVGGRVPLGGGDAALLCRDGPAVCAEL
jgi:proline iminopeptidase